MSCVLSGQIELIDRYAISIWMRDASSIQYWRVIIKFAQIEKHVGTLYMAHAILRIRSFRRKQQMKHQRRSRTVRMCVLTAIDMIDNDTQHMAYTNQTKDNTQSSQQFVSVKIG